MNKTFHSTLIVLFLLPVMAYAAQKNAVTIAVASNGKDPKSSISSKAGHCPYYLIFNGTGELIEVLGNPYKDAQRKAGQQTANFLANKGVTIVIAGNFGDKMIGVMRTNRTDYFKLQGIVQDAVKTVLGPGNQILIKLDRNLSPESYESYRKLINIEPDGRKREYVLFTVKKGKDKVAALFLSPASEKGRSTLRLVENMWLYIPNVGKPIRKVLPTKIECLTQASMLIKTIYFKQTKDFGGKIVRPSVIETDSPLHKGYKSVMIFAQMKKRTFKDEVFTLTFMPNLESLRQ